MDISREYERTHRWLTFNVTLSQASPRLWMRLGESQSKCMHIAGVPLQPDTAKNLYRLYLAKGVHATTAIEGNSLSEAEVLERIEKGKLDLPPSKEYLRKEIENILEICNNLKSDMNKPDFGVLSTEQIKNFNRQVLKDLTVPPDVVPGEIRKHSVVVANYRGAPAADCEYLLNNLCTWLNGSQFKAPNDDEKIVYGIIKAIVAHIYLAWIHPFGDGNGRTARIIEFYFLLSSGVPAPSAQLLSNHYNQTRSAYYLELAKTSTSLNGDLIPFIDYAVQGFLDQLKEQLERIRQQQWNVAWKNFVYDSFKGQDGPTAQRQIHLVLDLSEKTEPIPLTAVKELTPRQALAYANKTQKTIKRDINVLAGLKTPLVIRTPQGVRANKEIILAYLPERRGLERK
jgi:Fic family protein